MFSVMRLFVGFLVVLTGCDGIGGSRQSDGAQGEARVHPVVVQRPVVRDVEQSFVLPASLEPREVVELYSRVTGYLESLSVDIGDRVEDGQELARVLVPEMEPSLRRAEANVEAAKAEVAQQTAAVQLAGLTRQRLGQLRRTEKEAVAQHDVDVAAAGERTHQAELEHARASLHVAEAELAHLNALRRFSVLRAPFPGRVIRRVLHPGALVREGTSSGAQPVLDIARTDSLRLVFSVPEQLVPHVRVGQPVKVSLDAFPGRSRDLVVSRISHSLDPKTRSMRVEADVVDDSGELAPGMFANVELGVTIHKSAVVVSSRTVRGTGDGRYVFVVRDDVVRKIPVTVASEDGREAVIVNGLVAEDQVLTSGSPLLREGSLVQVVEAKAG